jgi:hypothetical protein
LVRAWSSRNGTGDLGPPGKWLLSYDFSRLPVPGYLYVTKTFLYGYI